jgi:crotonobetainyl-CoA:carnitine CoA-transferase CaiB-like acyl-CoA transferase
MQQHTFFKDLKVIEFASVLAGPAVGLFFAELGAEVIKVENKPTQGDVTRSWKLPTEDKNKFYSAYFCAVNWNKKHYFLDLQEETDRNIVYEWIKTADVVISNFKISSAEKMGMDYHNLKKINSKLIYAQLTSYGEDDETPAFDIVMQAEAGFLYMTGEPNRAPVRMPVALIDLLAAHQLKEGILVALLHRERSGEGSYITTSLLASAMASLANQATNWLMEGHIPEPMGTMHPNIAPYGDIFYSSNHKAIVMAVGTERQFENMCNVLHINTLLHDERFIGNGARVKNRAELKRLLQLEFSKFEQNDLMEAFKSNGVPAGRILNMKEVFEQPKAKQLILEEKMDDNTVSQRVKTVVFEIRH